MRKKPLCSVLLPTDTRHVLKIRKDPFRGVDEIDWKKATFANEMPSPGAVAM